MIQSVRALARALAAAALLLHVSLTRAEAQSISPRLDLSVPSSAAIDITGRFSRTSETRSDSTAYRAKSRLTIMADGDGWLRTYGAAVATDGNMGPATGAFAPDATTRIPTTFRLASDGRYDGLRDTATLRARVDSSLAPQLERLMNFPKQVRDGYVAAAAVTTLDARVEHAWWQLEGAMLSRTWKPGDSLSTSFTERNANMPGANIPFVHTIRFVGTAKCPPTSGAKRCWQFSAHTDMEMEGMRRVMATLMKQMGQTDERVVDQIPIPQTSVVFALLYDTATSRLLDATISTTIESKGSATLKVAASIARSDVHLRYQWTPR